MTSAALASVLRSGRDHFNTRFAEARRRFPDLDAAAFQQFLLTEIDPLAQAVALAAPARTTDVVIAAYDAALDLLGHKLIGPTARDPHIALGWRKIFPAIAPLIAAAPAATIAGICNALHQLAAAPGAAPRDWIERMAKLGSRCENSDTLLRLGQFAAWRAGLAHFRTSALALADQLPAEIALAALDVPFISTPWTDIRDRLRRDRWYDPAAPAELVPSLRVVREAGAFRGFGGLFIAPPSVTPAPDENYHVASGDERWLLTADVFGATFHRAPQTATSVFPPPLPAPGRPSVTDFAMKWSGLQLSLGNYGRIKSLAAHTTTAAVTCSHTHAVLLIAKGAA